jgi:hypothetical protein
MKKVASLKIQDKVILDIWKNKTTDNHPQEAGNFLTMYK